MDGNPVTAWSPADRTTPLTVDLGRPVRVGSVRPTRTKRPTSYRVASSADGREWHAPGGATPARFVRVSVDGPAALAELDVRH